MAAPRGDFLVWDAADEGGSCVLQPPARIARDWELYEGIPRAATFPPDAFLRMSDDHPRNIRLTDNLINLAQLAVVSERLQALLEERSVPSVEYLPVTILNHKGRPAAGRFFILHATTAQDCLDVAQSGCTYSSLVPGDVLSVNKLVIDPARIDPRIAIFRIKTFASPLLVRRDVASDLLAAGLRGLSFIELDEWES